MPFTTPCQTRAATANNNHNPPRKSRRENSKTVAGPNFTDGRLTVDVIRAGLSYKFGGPLVGGY
jgi:hypothetical protein